MNEMKVSIIIPVYNVENYLKECIMSVINQTYVNLEIILVDDGSTDLSGKICDEYKEKDTRIKVLHQENKGLSGARNAGIDIATGEYLCFIDSDDWIESTMIQKMLEVFLNNKVDLVICNILKFWENKEENSYKVEDYIYNINDFVSKYRFFPRELFVISCNKMYKRSLFDNIRYPEGYIHEDEAIIHHIYGQCHNVAMISQPLYHYRQRSTSIMRSEFNIKRTDIMTAYADRIVYAYKRGWKEMYNECLVQYNNVFWEYFFKFSNKEDNNVYIHRMRKSLKKILPYIWKCKEIQIRHKIYMTIININPLLYQQWKRR